MDKFRHLGSLLSRKDGCEVGEMSGVLLASHKTDDLRCEDMAQEGERTAAENGGEGAGRKGSGAKMKRKRTTVMFMTERIRTMKLRWLGLEERRNLEEREERGEISRAEFLPDVGGSAGESQMR